MEPSNSAKATNPARPIAAATIELKGRKTKVPRDHLIKVTLELRSPDGKHVDEPEAMNLARKALVGFAPLDGEPDLRRFEPIQTSVRKPDAVRTTIGVEASVLWAGRPGDTSIQSLRAALAGDGYKVTVRETRECSESDCGSDAMVEWNRPLQVPAGWYSSLVCGKHDYKTCGRCKSVYLMTSSSAAGQAPSLRCEVCGSMIIEWGSTKLWSAQLVTRGDQVH
jgi:hypothetical protein